MKQNLHIDDPWDLMAKILAEEASEAEKAAFSAWIEEDPAHQQQWEEAQALWAKQLQQPAASDPNVDQAWQAMKTRIQPAASPAKTFSLNRSPIYLTAIAAAIALVLVFWQPWQRPPVIKTLQTQADERGVVSLADGSEVWLNEKSSLQYGQEMKGDERRIQLSGEAFFEVARDEERPFVIEAGNTRVQVLGTSFNVRAYSNEAVELSVKSGKVLFFKGEKLLPDSSNAQILVAGEQAILEEANEQPVMQESPSVNYLAWRDNELIFHHARLGDVVEALSRYYGVAFEWENEQWAEMKFHADSAYNGVPLSVILEEIMISNQHQIRFEKKEGGYLIK